MNSIDKKWVDRIFQDLNDRLIAEFYIYLEDEDIIEEDAYIEVVMYWEKQPMDKYLVPPLLFNKIQNLNYSFENNTQISGTLEWTQLYDPELIENNGIYGKFNYALPNKSEWYYEGFMISFKTSSPVPPEPPGPPAPPITPPVNPTNNVSIITPDTFEDLFPYIYMNSWPEIDNEQLKYNFVGYTSVQTSPPEDAFFKNLNGKTRTEIDNEAVKLIENKDPYKDVFISSQTDLSGFISQFVELLTEIKLQEAYPDIVGFVCDFFDTTTDKFKAYLDDNTYLVQKERLWQSYFALFIRLGYKYKWLDYISENLVACNLLEEVFDHIDNSSGDCSLETYKIVQLSFASILLPHPPFPLPAYESSPPVSGNDNGWVEPYAIGNLQLVRQKLLKYERGDIAQIMNVMPGERKEIVKRKLNRITEENQTSTSSHNKFDSVTSENSKDFTSEVLNTLAHTKNTYNYQDLTTTYGAPTNITIDGTWTKEKESIAPAKKDISSFAKKILNTTTKRISEKVSEVRSKSSMDESEETSTSQFDNRKKTVPVFGIYYWLNKIYEARVINYGNRLIFSLMVSKPASRYIKLSLNLQDENFVKPESPSKKFNINSFKDIDESNYAEICNYYQIKNIRTPPEKQMVITETLESNESKLMKVPEAYEATTAHATYIVISGSTSPTIKAIIGTQQFSLDQDAGSTGPLNMNNENTVVAVSAGYMSQLSSLPSMDVSFFISIEIICSRSQKEMEEWQIEMYHQVLNAYEKLLQEYDDQFDPRKNKDLVNNPLYDKQTVRKELKRSCIRKLVEQMIEVKGIPPGTPNSPAAFEVNKPMILQFLNYALEWEEMTYTLLEELDTSSIYTEMTSLSLDQEHLFTAFLQAEGAKMLVPVRPEYNHRLLLYLASGMIWFGKDLLVPAMPEQATLVNEIKRVFEGPDTIEIPQESWEIKVPTSLQILQQTSAGM